MIALLALVIVIGAIVWVSPARSARPMELYTEMPKLGGVALGTPVLLNGFQVGQVDKVDPHMAHDGLLHFRIRMAISWQVASADSTPYREGMRVRVAVPALDVFGGSALNLEPSLTPGAPLKPGTVLPSDTDIPLITRTDTRIDSLTHQLTLALADVRTLVASIDKTANAATETARGANALTVSIDKHLGVLAGNAQTSIARADSLVQDLRTLQPVAKGATDSLNALVSDSRKALGQVSTLIGTEAPKLSNAIDNLDATTAVLTNFLQNISERPTRLLTGVKAPPRPVKRDTTRTAP